MTNQISLNSQGALNVPYANYIQQAANKTGLDPKLIASVISAESSFNPQAHSGAGAAGLMQLMPKTASGLGVSNPYDPQQSIMGGSEYLAQAIKNNGGSIPLGLAAYNAGQGNVDKYHGIPPFTETQNYVKRIMGMYNGSSNIDVNNLTGSGGSTSSNPLDIAGTIVNGFQKIFQTMFTDTTKFFIYIVLFGLMIFFAYKALQGSPPINEGMKNSKRAAKNVVKTGKTIYTNQKNKAQNEREKRLAARARVAKLIKEVPKV